MAMTLKLGELRAARQAMTRGQYEYDGTRGTIEARDGGVNRFLGKSICEMFISNHKANAAGLVSTHNAADALIKIAEAARLMFPEAGEPTEIDFNAAKLQLLTALGGVQS